MPAYSKIVLRSAILLLASIHTIIYSGITNSILYWQGYFVLAGVFVGAVARIEFVAALRTGAEDILLQQPYA